MSNGVTLMRKLAFTAAAGAFVFSLAAPAFAQDVPVEDAPFTGPRIEALAGYDHANGRGDSRDGIVYGGAIGYDAQVGGVILGVDGEYTDATTRYCAKTGRDLYAGGRIGYAISPVAMVYAKAGYTNASVKTRYTTATTVNNDSDKLDGYRVGAGIEYKMGSNAYVKGEYRYSNYANPDAFRYDLERHQVLAGVGYRF